MSQTAINYFMEEVMKGTVDKNDKITPEGLQRSHLHSIYMDAKESNAARIIRNSKPKHRNPMIITPEHKKLVDLLRSHLDKGGKFTIAIDGVDGTGKSSLAHYLAWQLNLSVIETDLCRKQRSSKITSATPNELFSALKIDLEVFDQLIRARHEMNAPTIVEGTFILQSLEDIGIKTYFLILRKKPGWNGSFDFTAYNKKFSNSKPDYELIWSADDSL